MIGCLWVECSMNGWRPITRMCSFSQKVIPRIPQLAAKSCKCTQRKKVLLSPSPPTKFQGKQSFTAEKLWSFRTQFLCHLLAVFLVSCTNQPYLTGGSNILPTHPPVPADTGVSHTWSIPENPASCFLHSLHPSQSTSLIWWWTWCH